MIAIPHPLRLTLIRHGEVEDTYHQVFGGSRIDMALSPLGHQQGEAIATHLKGQTLHALYASPMLRVQQTIAPLLRETAMKPIIMPDLREIDFGDWTGSTWSGVKDKFGISAYAWLTVLTSPEGMPNGESWTQLRQRVGTCLETILHAHPDEHIAIACHGGIVRVILALLLHVPMEHTSHYRIDYGTLTTVELEPEKPYRVEITGLNYAP